MQVRPLSGHHQLVVGKQKFIQRILERVTVTLHC